MKIVDFTCNGECSNCGNCCSDILPMSDKEIRRIRNYVRKHKIKEHKMNVFNGIDMTCPFRDNEERKCLIYSVRPEICRTFLCCKEESTILEERDEIERTRNTVLVRNQFYGSVEDVIGLQILTKGFIK